MMSSTLTSPASADQAAHSRLAIRVYNTLSKTKEPFLPLRAPRVGMYLCGPTVYAESHIGHMVGPVIFDTIKRYLTYCGYDVTFVVNITDVDDKLTNKSKERGIPMSQIAWTSGDGSFGDGAFAGTPSQLLMSAQPNRSVVDFLTFRYLNSTVPPAGNYQGRVRFTLSVP